MRYGVNLRADCYVRVCELAVLIFGVRVLALDFTLEPDLRPYFLSVRQLSCTIKDSPDAYTGVIGLEILIARKLVAYATMLNGLFLCTGIEAAFTPVGFPFHIPTPRTRVLGKCSTFTTKGTTRRR
jgi:hypothetical protein